MLNAGLMVSVRALLAVVAGAALSETWTVMLDVPLAFVVPLRRPLELSPMPAGKVPEASDQVNGEVPPASVNCWE